MHAEQTPNRTEMHHVKVVFLKFFIQVRWILYNAFQESRFEKQQNIYKKSSFFVKNPKVEQLLHSNLL